MRSVRISHLKVSFPDNFSEVLLVFLFPSPHPQDHMRQVVAIGLIQAKQLHERKFTLFKVKDYFASILLR